MVIQKAEQRKMSEQEAEILDFLIITGLSGSGKSQVVRALEDLGYFCVDNMPPQLIVKFAEICYASSGQITKAAVVCDIRGGRLFNKLSDSLEELSAQGHRFDILFLEASDDILISRYRQTRRNHPLARNGRIVDGIRRETEILKNIRAMATHVIDTSLLTPAQLKEHVNSIYGSGSEFEGMVINVVSFGFKYGIPVDSDLVFDVRFLPNPFYIPELKRCTGLQSNVSDYVMSFEQSREFLRKLIDMADYLIPHYIEEGKSQLVIAVGCTGGHHRSVTIAEKLYKHLRENKHHVVVTHRDIEKGV